MNRCLEDRRHDLFVVLVEVVLLGRRHSIYGSGVLEMVHLSDREQLF